MTTIPGVPSRAEGLRAAIGTLVHVFRRLAIFAAAIVYITVSIEAVFASNRVLLAKPIPAVPLMGTETSVIVDWAGATTIRESPLVQTLLRNETTPRPSGVIYLENATTASGERCATEAFDPRLYGPAFLRTLYGTLAATTAYNLSFIATNELIVPVVDCTFASLVNGDKTLLRAFFLTRRKLAPEDVTLVALTLSIQDYRIPKQKQFGAAGVGTLALVRDLRASAIHHVVVAQGYPFAALRFQVYTLVGITADHEWELENVPALPGIENVKRLVTASRTGFYINAPTEQANIKHNYWALEADPRRALGRIPWEGGPVLRDSWAWVHYIHVLFAADTLFNLVVFCLVVYRNLRAGRLWIGDAFVSISNTLLYRGVLILVTWVVNEFWTLREFCVVQANAVAHIQEIVMYPEIVRADLLTLFLSYASFAGYLLRERIDPALVVVVFEIAFTSRLAITDSFPHTKGVLTRVAEADYALGNLPVSDVVAAATPMAVWSVHRLPPLSPAFIFWSLLPTFSSGAVVAAYALARKLHRRLFPERLHIQRFTSYREDLDALVALQSKLTVFELATGAPLQRRVGVVSDYENCLYIRGVKHASADGIYSSGYVIANGKFLIGTADLLSILFIKLTRVRFRNVYVNAVNGTTVQETAQLVYPQTIAWEDLIRLNVGRLS